MRSKKHYDNAIERSAYLNMIRSKLQTCECCGRKFYSLTFSPCCSRRCMERMVRITKGHTFGRDKCLYCGNEFSVNRVDKYFCSNKCRIAFRKSTVETPNAKYDHVCLNCSKPFKSSKRTCNYCSNRCYNQHLKNIGYFRNRYLKKMERMNNETQG